MDTTYIRKSVKNERIISIGQFSSYNPSKNKELELEKALAKRQSSKWIQIERQDLNQATTT